MAIQNRRGNYKDFDPSKLLPGEYAIVQANDPTSVDGRAVYMCFASGNVKRLATLDELSDLLSLSPEQYALLTEAITALQGNTTVMVDLNNRVNIVEAEIAGIHSDLTLSTDSDIDAMFA